MGCLPLGIASTRFTARRPTKSSKLCASNIRNYPRRFSARRAILRKSRPPTRALSQRRLRLGGLGIVADQGPVGVRRLRSFDFFALAQSLDRLLHSLLGIDLGEASAALEPQQLARVAPHGAGRRTLTVRQTLLNGFLYRYFRELVEVVQSHNPAPRRRAVQGSRIPRPASPQRF